MKALTYKHTLISSYMGSITLSIVNGLPPLLFLTFQREFGFTLSMVTTLITINFLTQLLIDLAASKFVDIIGYRASAVMAQMFCFAGLLGMGILPYLFSNHYIGLVLAVMISAVGAGLNEVLISPIVEALPGEKKAASMSLLHSFYCWGVVLTIIVSTIFFNIFGTGNWRYLIIAWSILPLFNSFFFSKVPLRKLVEEHETAIPLRKLFSKKIFLLLFLLMICAGASEQAMSQWVSLFAEAGLNVSKTTGDLLGPCFFAILMGIARIFYALKMSHYSLENSLLVSSILCIVSYLVTVFSPNPILSLLGCGLCGLSVGILWPVTFSLSSKHYPMGGTAMFAILALAGDAGCSTGPSLVGWISNAVQNQKITFTANLFSSNSITELSLKSGLLLAVIFPFVLGLGAYILKKRPAKG